MNYKPSEMQRMFGSAPINQPGKKKSDSIKLDPEYCKKMRRLKAMQDDREEAAAMKSIEVWEE